MKRRSSSVGLRSEENIKSLAWVYPPWINQLINWAWLATSDCLYLPCKCQYYTPPDMTSMRNGTSILYALAWRPVLLSNWEGIWNSSTDAMSVSDAAYLLPADVFLFEPWGDPVFPQPSLVRCPFRYGRLRQSSGAVPILYPHLAQEDSLCWSWI